MKRKRDKPVTQRRRIVLPEEDEDTDEWAQSVEDAYERSVERYEERYNIYHAMRQVEGVRTALNKAQARLEKVAKVPKKVANDFRQFLQSGGTTADEWMAWDSSKPNLVVRQKRGLRLVVNRKIVRYRIREDDDGPKAA